MKVFSYFVVYYVSESDRGSWETKTEAARRKPYPFTSFSTCPSQQTGIRAAPWETKLEVNMKPGRAPARSKPTNPRYVEPGSTPLAFTALERTRAVVDTRGSGAGVAPSSGARDAVQAVSLAASLLLISVYRSMPLVSPGLPGRPWSPLVRRARADWAVGGMEVHWKPCLVVRWGFHDMVLPPRAGAYSVSTALAPHVLLLEGC